MGEHPRTAVVARRDRLRALLLALPALVACASVLAPASALAQATLGEMRRQATRQELEAAAKAAESAAVNAPDEKTRRIYRETATAYRLRLENGDFLPGDRILLDVLGDTLFSDTFTVRNDRKLLLPNLPEISLHGVLDSELEPFMTKELSRYLRSVELTATVLLRLSLLGAVGRQDFITVPVDMALPDVISAAGGFSGQPDLGKAAIRRGDRVHLDSRGLQEAFQKGKTVGDLSLRDGDVVFIPTSTQTGPRWQVIAAGLGSVAGLFWIIRGGRGF